MVVLREEVFGEPKAESKIICDGSVSIYRLSSARNSTFVAFGIV